MEFDVTSPRRALILVVDDEPAQLELVANLLRSEYDVRVLRGGGRALAFARQHRPDLVLLDVAMPEFDGYQVCQQLTSCPELDDLPVIFLSARGSIQDEAHGLSLGAIDFIHKPVSPPLLRARVRTHLAMRTAREGMRREKRNAERLLEVVLPRVAAEELRLTDGVAPRRIERSAVLFAGVSGFEAWTASHSPEEIVPTLHRLFLEFEGITRAHGLEKLKTIGHQFMAGAGLLEEHDEPLAAAVRAGVDMVAATQRLVREWQLCVGVNLGPLVAGVVGGERFQFDVWGDTVNVAARLAMNGSPGAVTIPSSLGNELGSDFEVRHIGARHLKGKGAVELAEAWLK